MPLPIPLAGADLPRVRLDASRGAGAELRTRCLIFQVHLGGGAVGTMLRSRGVRAGAPCSGIGRVVLRLGRVFAPPTVVGRFCEWRPWGERLGQEVPGCLPRPEEDNRKLCWRGSRACVGTEDPPRQHRVLPPPSGSLAWLMLGEGLRGARRSLAIIFALVFLLNL